MSLLLGPRTLAWPTLALLAVAGLLGAFVGDPSADLPTRMLWLGAGAIAQIALTAVYLLASALGAGRYRIAVLAAVVLGAAARAASLSLILQQVSVTDPLDTDQRLLSATVTYTAWGVILGVVVQGYTEYSSRITDLLSRVDRTLADSRALASEWERRLQDTAMTPQALERAAAALHEDVERRLRPLSHRLWLGLTHREMRQRFGTALLTEPLPIVWIVVVSVPLYMWPVAHHLGLVTAALVGLTTALGVGIVLAAGEGLARQWPHIAVIARIGSIVLAAAVPAAVDRITDDVVYPAGTAVVTVMMVTAIISVQIIAVALRQRRRSIADLNGRIDTLERQRREVATYLHSTMQSRWTAAALRLQEAAERGDAEAARQALAQARGLVDSERSDALPLVDLEEVARSWEGIAAIDLTIPADLPDDARSPLGHLIEEAVANAVRHGRARNVSILVTVTESCVEVVVSDDGIGVSPQPRQGLGTRWRNEVARWELTSSERGSRLNASIPRKGG